MKSERVIIFLLCYLAAAATVFLWSGALRGMDECVRQISPSGAGGREAVREETFKISDAGYDFNNADPVFAAAPPVSSRHLFGGSQARFTLYLYSDFSCIYCRNLFRPLLEYATASRGEVNIVFRHFPLHENGAEALLRAVMSECYGSMRGNRGFWIAASMLFETADYRRINRVLNVGEEQLVSCIRNEDPLVRVESDVLEGRNSGIPGTPSVVIEDLHTGKRVVVSGVTKISQIDELVMKIKSGGQAGG